MKLASQLRNIRNMRDLRQIKNQNGFTLVEVGIVVAIAAIIIGVSLMIVPRVIVQNRVNAEAQEIPGIAAKIQRAYANRSTYTGISNTVVSPLNIFPAERIGATPADLLNRWGGTITVSATTTTVAGDTLQMAYTNVPSDDCIELVQAISATPRRILVGATVVKPAGGVVDLTALPTACNAASNVNITYEFTK